MLFSALYNLLFEYTAIGKMEIKKKSNFSKI